MSSYNNRYETHISINPFLVMLVIGLIGLMV